jgi:hypothetical protein
MSDVFISYAEEDRDRAREVAMRLTREGWSVFWDRTIPVGSIWDDILERELNTAKVIVVLWSKASVGSEWVRIEASVGAERKILAPVFLESATIPVRFKLSQTANISDWKSGASDTEGMQSLVDAVCRIGNLRIKRNTQTNKFSGEKYIEKPSEKVEKTKIVEIIKPEITDKIKDIDGNEYGIVTIGNQIWMAENLRTTKFNDGTPIPLVTNHEAWYKLNSPGYCWYDNDEKKYRDVYGALYNWYAVNTGKLCPKGWHVPSDAEWTELITFLGGEMPQAAK